MLDQIKPKQGIVVNNSFLNENKIVETFLNDEGKFDLTEINKLRELCHKLYSRNEFRFNAGELRAVVFITIIFQSIYHKYRKNIAENIDNEIMENLVNRIGTYDTSNLFSDFNKNFNTVFTADEKIVEDLIITCLINDNPAFKNYRSLFSDVKLRNKENYNRFKKETKSFFKQKPPMIGSNLDLIDYLWEPIRKHPYSIIDQLTYIKENWKEFLDIDLSSILKSIDILKEEQKFGLPGPGPSKVHKFDKSYYGDEYENFSEDLHWMPRLILLAKSTYVWLSQLSKKYNYEIKRLDQIPDQELQEISEQGFTGLWLIGIWERSKASKRIKQIKGNPDALASAYSLKEYRIANLLGGESSMDNLRNRAWKYGIRVSCDMVPNHFGLDSNWLLDNPDCFIQSDTPPYPSYSFNGENLSGRDDIIVQIEDHYYDHTDAAVVFKYHNKNNNRTRYIYHGNDGTSFPWNDTAQLNYLIPQVRENVIRKIIEIAKKFPIIRFDAAMTLAKKHYQRLWFPKPGSGGDIPSRSSYSMTPEEFHRVFPKEFWREVVDRAAVEAPNTLLLAEAFWMMEGYFVRTLGMHRVYNSAFMNMLKDEENEKYRQSIFNIIEFNPEILKRFVNFMSNPDEETAIVQFGKDDKYFGVCVLMSTMPGLPMFAHGQIEGYVEKYGMEYSAPKWNEEPDKNLIERHKKEIFPLLKQRYLFAEVEDFLLFDFENENGHVDNDIFAYSNRYKDNSSLVVYNNKYKETKGFVEWASTIYTDSDGKKHWHRKNLATALKLHYEDYRYVIFYDSIKQQYFIYTSKEIADNGLKLDLNAYDYRVFTRIYEVSDDKDRTYSKLYKHMAGRPFPDIDIAIEKLGLLDIHESFKELIKPKMIERVKALYPQKANFNSILDKLSINKKIKSFVNYTYDYVEGEYSKQKYIETIKSALRNWLDLISPDNMIQSNKRLTDHWEHYSTLLYYWSILRKIGSLVMPDNSEWISKGWVDNLYLSRILVNNFNKHLGLKDSEYWIDLLKLGIQYQNIWKLFLNKNYDYIIRQLTEDIDVKNFLSVNRYNNRDWFNKERFEDLFNFIYLVNKLCLKCDSEVEDRKKNKYIQDLTDYYDLVLKAEKKSDYIVRKFLWVLKHEMKNR